MFRSLSGRFLILTIIFVMLAEVLIFVPSVARFREDYLLNRLERAQIASLALLADDMIESPLAAELLKNADVFNVVLRRDEVRQLILSSPIPAPISETVDLRDPTAFELIRDALFCLVGADNKVIRVIGHPVHDAGLLIEVTMGTDPLRVAIINYGWRVLALSAVISIFTAVLLFVAVRALIVKPIEGVVGHMQTYAANPADARRIIEPSASVTELRSAEEALQSMQTDLTSALKQRERLAQLGEAVAKVSHDLRNILTSAQLFTDRIENSEDPVVQRMAPKLVGSITRAVNLCESTLAFGRAEEPAPRLNQVHLGPLVHDIIDSEILSAGDAGVTLTADIPDGLTVRADAEQIYRVIFNIVRNARQAIMRTGHAGQITIKAWDNPDHWSIRISDTGPGLPSKARDKLFTPFEGGVTKGGSGLGLPIARELVAGHGGTLELVKSDGQGTKFLITLPKGNLEIAA